MKDESSRVVRWIVGTTSVLAALVAAAKYAAFVYYGDLTYTLAEQARVSAEVRGLDLRLVARPSVRIGECSVMASNDSVPEGRSFWLCTLRHSPASASDDSVVFGAADSALRLVTAGCPQLPLGTRIPVVAVDSTIGFERQQRLALLLLGSCRRETGSPETREVR